MVRWHCVVGDVDTSGSNMLAVEFVILRLGWTGVAEVARGRKIYAWKVDRLM
jgi:hypothetical protein